MLLILAQEFQEQSQRFVLRGFLCCLVLLMPIVAFYYIAYERGEGWYRTKFAVCVLLPGVLAPFGWLFGLCLVVFAFLARSISSSLGSRLLLEIILHSDQTSSRFAKSFYRASQLPKLCRFVWPWWMHKVEIRDDDLLSAARLGLLSAATAPRSSSYSVTCQSLVSRLGFLPKPDQALVLRHLLVDPRAQGDAASILFSHLVSLIEASATPSELNEISAAFVGLTSYRALNQVPFFIELIPNARNKTGPSLSTFSVDDIRDLHVLLLRHLARLLGWHGSGNEVEFLTRWCRLRDEASAAARKTLETRLAAEILQRRKLAAENASVILPDLLRRWKELQMYPTHPERASVSASICVAYAAIGDVSQFHKWANDAFMCSGILGVQEDKTEASIRFLGMLTENDVDTEFAAKANLWGLVGALQHTVLNSISSESSFWMKVRMMFAYYRGAKNRRLPISFDSVRIDFATQIQNARQHLEAGEHIGRCVLVCIQNAWLGEVAQTAEQIVVAECLRANPQTKMLPEY